MRAVDELKAAGTDEAARRQQLENALRESAAIFKRELYDKNQELQALHSELRWVLHYELRWGQEAL